MTDRPLVTVIDDDESVRESLPDLLKVLGYRVQAFDSAAAFLNSENIDETECLILDVAMPEMTGPELRGQLIRLGYEIPVIFITAHRGEFALPLGSGKGEVECLNKPFTEKTLVKALQRAVGPGESIAR